VYGVASGVIADGEVDMRAVDPGVCPTGADIVVFAVGGEEVVLAGAGAPGIGPIVAGAGPC